MNIQEDIKARWDDFTTGKTNAMKLMNEYIENDNNHLPVQEIHKTYVLLKSDRARIEKEVVDKIKGVFLLNDAISDPVTEKITPAVYYTYSTKSALLASITSELWDVTDIVAETQGELSWTNYIKTL